METDKGDAPDLITSLRDQISNLGSKLEASEKDNAVLREALEEVMSWINNWSTPFTEDDEWETTEKIVSKALTGSKPIQGGK